MVGLVKITMTFTVAGLVVMTEYVTIDIRPVVVVGMKIVKLLWF